MKEFNGGLRKQHQVSIGIDQSLTGFAFSAVSVESPLEHMTWVYKSPYNGVQRLADIQSFLRGRFEWLGKRGNSVSDIAMENTVRASFAALVLGELAGAVKLFLFEYYDSAKNYWPEYASYRRTPLLIAPTMVKKYATGKGNAKKQEMLLQIFKRWGVEFTDDNAADAYALARIAGGHAIDDVEQSILDAIADKGYRDTVK